MNTKSLRYNIILKPEPEGGYTVLVPSLPGCVSYGVDVDEALSMAKEAVEAYLESLQKNNEPIPADDASSLVFPRISLTQ
ncbi:MAG: type II toxin-antitoxin system HicB family antitoxin [Candidatus Hinthialibacter sp.]